MRYKPGKQNVVADALSRRPDYELAHVVHLQDSDLNGIIEALGLMKDSCGCAKTIRFCVTLSSMKHMMFSERTIYKAQKNEYFCRA